MGTFLGKIVRKDDMEFFSIVKTEEEKTFSENKWGNETFSFEMRPNVFSPKTLTRFSMVIFSHKEISTLKLHHFTIKGHFHWSIGSSCLFKMLGLFFDCFRFKQSFCSNPEVLLAKIFTLPCVCPCVCVCVCPCA